MVIIYIPHFEDMKNEYVINIDSKNYAKVFLDKMNIDKGTMKQIKYMITHPSVERVRIMPDCHRGKSCCIGFTSKLTEKIVPSYVGSDIGCGIITYNTQTNISDLGNYDEIERIIRSNVPMGTKDNCIHKGISVTDNELVDICKQSEDEAYNFAKSYEETFGKNIQDYIPKYSIEWFKTKCQQIDINYDYVLKSLGSLGGGNHYVEVNCEKSEIGNDKNTENAENTENNNDNDGNRLTTDSNAPVFITIHTGSRNFGGKICAYHQMKINETKHFDYDAFKSQMKKVKRKIKDNRKIKMIEDDVRNKITESRHPDFLEDEESYAYLFDMIFAQKYAQLNREIILRNILNGLHVEYDKDNLIESIHNYIDFNDMILRKGAIAAHKDKLCIISLNMRDGILLCRGLGNEEWNYSAAHGSGRLLNRQQAQSKIKLKDFQESMKGIYSTSVLYETIDESPFAYKSTELIKNCLEGTVEIVKHLKPIINVKALT